jgi:hypothetical protein
MLELNDREQETGCICNVFPTLMQKPPMNLQNVDGLRWPVYDGHSWPGVTAI